MTGWHRLVSRALLWSMGPVLLSTSLANPSSTSSEAWPGFRGPRVDGIAPATSVFASRKPVGLQVAWKKSIGSGYSAVAIEGGRVVTMYSTGTQDVVASYDAGTGEPQWSFELEETYVGHDGSHTGPLSTPLIAAGHVFALSARGRLVALSANDGSLAWSVNLVEGYRAIKPHYGFTSSPILMDGVLVVQTGAEKASVAGIDPKTGKLLWETGEDGVTYQSPMPYRLGGMDFVLAPGQKKLTALEPGSGHQLWEYEHGGGGARGISSMNPVPVGANRLFMSYKDDSSTLIELRGQGKDVSFSTIWDDRSIRNSYNVPVYHDGHIYAFSSRFLTCVDVATGKSKWRSRQPGDGFLILVDDYLVIATKEGGLFVVRANPEKYDEVAGIERLFDDLAWSPPGFAGGSIFVRSLGELARVDISDQESKSRDESASDPVTSSFDRFLKSVATADNKKEAVDKFLATVTHYPLIEGDGRVHFLYRGPGDDLAVAGDLFGARQEHRMTRIAGTDLHYCTVNVEPDARFNYRFIRDYEDILDPNNSRTTTTTIYGPEMEMSFGDSTTDMCWVSMPKWRRPLHLDDHPKTRPGRIESHRVESEGLDGTFNVQVYLPADYDDTSKRFPVAYVHSGEAALKRGEMSKSLDFLLGRSVAPSIVVFLTGEPKERNARNQWSRYAEGWAKDLVPFVDQSYRTLQGKSHRAHIGHGFAGFSSLYCALSNPELAGKVANQSSFIFGSMKSQLDSLMTSAKEKPLEIYIEWGKYDLRNPHEAWDLAQTNRDLAKELTALGYTVTGGEVNDGTGWSSWKNRTDLLFQAVFPMN